MKPDTISLKKIIGDIKRHPMLTRVPEEAIADYAVEFLRILGIAETYEEKLVTLEVKDYRAVLPKDFDKVIQVRLLGESRFPIYFRSTTDNFYQSDNKSNAVYYTYKIQGHVIYTSPLKEGTIEVAYRAVQLDDCGLPAIPDNAKYERALKAYIKVQEFTTLFDTGQISLQALQNAQQEYSWAVASVTADLKTPTEDEMESFANIMNSILPRHTHYRGYADNGSAERRRKY